MFGDFDSPASYFEVGQNIGYNSDRFFSAYAGSSKTRKAFAWGGWDWEFDCAGDMKFLSRNFIYEGDRFLDCENVFG